MTSPAVKATGAIKWINAAKPFGLVTRDDGGDDLFAGLPHLIESDETRELKITQKVSYDIGLIHYSRGRISVVDRPGLEIQACECYKVVKKEFDRLLPNEVPQE
jgi:cold shock CspA family protein